MKLSINELGLNPRSSFTYNLVPRVRVSALWVVAAFAAVSFGLIDRTSAQETPPGCSFAGAGASMTRFPATNVQHGQEICYRLSYTNGAAGVNCEIRDFDADLILPNGTNLPMLAGATILSGEKVACPSGDPRCVTASNCGIAGQIGYSYIVDHADEVFKFFTCPPNTVPGIGRIVAYTEGLGDSLTKPPDFASACATANNLVPHGACCDPCTGICNDTGTADECQFPSVFTPNRSCDEVACTPLDCSGLITQCDDARCNPATGACEVVHKPFSTPCEVEGPPNLCTNDHCDGEGRCVLLACKPPAITCPPDKIFECDAVGDFGDPTVVDDCLVSPTVECTEEPTPGKLPQERTIIRSCTATNDCGGRDQCQQRIDIVDTTPPEVTCPPGCTLECGDVQCVPPQCADPSCECGGVATCEDNCSTCTVSVTCEIVPKDCTPGQAAGLTPPPKLTVVRTFQAADGVAGATATGEGNIETCVQRIEIVDSTPPALDPAICSRTIRICAGDEVSFTPPTCSDICGTCDVICVRSDNLPFPGPPPSGPITVTCVASDECGNEASCGINVEVSDGEECFKVIPTMSEWGLVILTLLLLTGAKVFFGRPQTAAA